MERIILNLDHEWRFHKGDVIMPKLNSHADSYSSCKSGAVVGPAGKIWNDVDWRTVNLPHDYYAESDFSEENVKAAGILKRFQNNDFNTQYEIIFIFFDCIYCFFCVL